MSHEISEQEMFTEFFLLMWECDLNRLPGSAVLMVRTLNSGSKDMGLGPQIHSLFCYVTGQKLVSPTSFSSSVKWAY